MKMWAIRSSETLVTTYKIICRHNPEGHHGHHYHREILKSQIAYERQWLKQYPGKWIDCGVHNVALSISVRTNIHGHKYGTKTSTWERLYDIGHNMARKYS